MSPAQEKELLQLFGRSAWREGQKELIHWALQGHNCLGVLPTGHGKSLCFQAAAQLLEGASLVISPLIALMRDQVEALKERGISAARYDSSLSEEERGQCLAQLQSGKLRLLYLAPESLHRPELTQALSQSKLGLLVIDEAHCLSEWGHSFRPDYLKLPQFYSAHSFHALMALTATAPPRVVQDLQAQFGIKPAHSLCLPPYRANIKREIIPTADKLATLKELLLGSPEKQASIIYCRSRKSCEEIANKIQSWGLKARCYHAGQPAEQREEIQDQFLHGKYPVLVATIAFGMGIDKSDLRRVIHYHAPSSPEAYLQESGRAGRDGKASWSQILLNHEDARETRNRIYAEQADEQGIIRCLRWLTPPYSRVISHWELSTECDIPEDLFVRCLQNLAPELQAIATGFKYYKVKRLYPLDTITDGRSNTEIARLGWLDTHPEGEVEQAAQAWDCSFADACEQLRDCEAAQEWSLSTRQNATQIRYTGKQSAAELADEFINYYQKRTQAQLKRWEQLLAMFTSSQCLNSALNKWFMGENSPPCGHCSMCEGQQAQLPAQKATQLEPPPENELPEFARDNQRKRFLLGINSPASMRRRLWAHKHYGCMAQANWEQL